MRNKEIKLPDLPIDKNYSPPYRTIVALNYLSHQNEYPNNAEQFIWGVPLPYTDRKDAEISAMTACFIYDGTYKSVLAAKEVDSWFKGKPFEYIINKEYNEIIMVDNQDVVVYGYLSLKDIFLFFKELNALFSEYDGVIGKCRFVGLKDAFTSVRTALSDFRGFRGESVTSHARIHLYLFIMVHCKEMYPFNESDLLAPIFPKQFIACKGLRLTKKSRLTTKTFVEITEKLKWFSEKYPMTFWVGVCAYSLMNKGDKLYGKFATMDNVRKKFRKR